MTVRYWIFDIVLNYMNMYLMAVLNYLRNLCLAILELNNLLYVFYSKHRPYFFKEMYCWIHRISYKLLLNKTLLWNLLPNKTFRDYQQHFQYQDRMSMYKDSRYDNYNDIMIILGIHTRVRGYDGVLILNQSKVLSATHISRSHRQYDSSASIT